MIMVLQMLVNGLMIGGVYSLVAVGLTINSGVMRIINFAHGDFLMVGMYFTLLLFPYLALGGLPYIMMPIVAILMFGTSALIYKFLIKPIIGTDESSGVILTMGLSYLLQNGFQLMFSPNYQTLNVPIAFKTNALRIGGLYVLRPRLISFAVSLILVGFVFWFLNKTDTGRAMRATAENTNVAKTLGINTNRMYMYAFCLGAILTAIAGLLLTPIFYVYPKAGALFTTMAMASIIMGGMGNIFGALVSGLIIGMIESVVGTLTSMDIALIVNNLVLITLLLVKPYGLFGGGMRKA